MRKFSVRLPVIPPPEPGTRSVLVQSEGVGPFTFLKGKGPGNLLCGKCAFKLADGVGLGNVRDVVFKCPVCGSHCDTPYIPALEQLVKELLSAPDPVLRASELKSKLIKAQESGTVKSDLSNEISLESEALGRLVNLLEPKTAGDFYSMLGCVIAFLAFVVMLRQPSSPQIVINQFIGSQERQPSYPRNGACHCGSGRKYKHCHGKNESHLPGGA